MYFTTYQAWGLKSINFSRGDSSWSIPINNTSTIIFHVLHVMHDGLVGRAVCLVMYCVTEEGIDEW